MMFSVRSHSDELIMTSEEMTIFGRMENLLGRVEEAQFEHIWILR